MADRDQLRLDVLLNEYNYVSGLIPMYRDVEARALSTVGLVLAGLASVVAALMATETDNGEVEGAIVSVAAWIFALFGSVQLTAQLRILRASEYLKRHLYPELEKLVGKKPMQFEIIPSSELLGIPDQGRSFTQRIKLRLVTSVANSVGLGVLGFAMPFLGAFAISQLTIGLALQAWWFWLGLVGGLIALLLALIGINLAGDVERNTKRRESANTLPL